MRVSAFNFDLPPDLIAQSPASPREAARLLAVGRSLRDLSIADLPGLIRPGDILVCTSTSPTWTPLFGTVGALVSDSGGVLSHTAIVAREYGLPAVVGVKDGTRRIADGQIITVDGDNGMVLLR